jgi:hypothetical protein
MQSLQKLWIENKSPIFNGVIYKDNKVTPLLFNYSRQSIDMEGVKSENLDEIILTAVGYSSLGQIGIYNFLDAGRLVFGGGSYGSDGFITYLVNTEVQWMIFFDWSGDFQICKPIDNERVLLVTDSYAKVGFAVSRLAPEQISIVSL